MTNIQGGEISNSPQNAYGAPFVGGATTLDTITSGELGEVIIKFSGDLEALERDLGYPIEDIGSGYAIVTMPYSQIPRLYSFRQVEYVERSKSLHWSMHIAMTRACISQVKSRPSFGLNGAGTIAAIIDSGIDYTHPDFRNDDGSTRILYIWDQSAPGTPSPGLSHGVEYNSAQINEALQSPDPFSIVPTVDTIGHGTAIAGVAAGNGRASGGVEAGVASSASLIVVKLGTRGQESFARTTEFMRALKYVIDRAEGLNMPVAVNISFGTNDGSHDGSSLFEGYINDQAMRWKTVISVATGNEGSAGHHYRGKAIQAQQISIPFTVGPNVSRMYISLWKNFVDTFGVELISPGGRDTGRVYQQDIVRTSNLEGATVVVEYGQPTHYIEDQNIYIIIDLPENYPASQGLWMLMIYPDRVVKGDFDIWLPTTEEVGTETAFSNPTPDTTLTLPSTAEGVISVGGYNQAIGATVGFSGRGFTRGGLMRKPDLVAPARDILAAKSGGGYDSFTGTSMAAPFVTGSACLIMQWGIVQGNDIFLYGQRVKAYLLKGAVQPSLPGITFPDPYWGYGTLCLKNTLDYLFDYTLGGRTQI